MQSRVRHEQVIWFPPVNLKFGRSLRSARSSGVRASNLPGHGSTPGGFAETAPAGQGLALVTGVLPLNDVRCCWPEPFVGSPYDPTSSFRDVANKLPDPLLCLFHVFQTLPTRFPTFGTAVRDPFQSEIFHHTIRMAWCRVRLYAAQITKRAVSTVSKPKHRKVVDRMASSAACKLACVDDDVGCYRRCRRSRVPS